jgi:hypothetical protein
MLSIVEPLNEPLKRLYEPVTVKSPATETAVPFANEAVPSKLPVNEVALIPPSKSIEPVAVSPVSKTICKVGLEAFKATEAVNA